MLVRQNYYLLAMRTVKINIWYSLSPSTYDVDSLGGKLGGLVSVRTNKNAASHNILR